MKDKQRATISHIFGVIVSYPKTVALLSILVFLVSLSFLPKLVKDTRSDAFLQKDNPALIYRDKVKAQFGLNDPMVIVIVNDSAEGIYNPSTLALVDWLTEQVSRLPNVSTEHVLSLATENNISGTEEGMDVTPFFNPVPQSVADIQALRSAIENFPLYQGTLVARNGKATVIVLEYVDEHHVETTYQALQALVQEAPVRNNEQLHVAGEGAIAGYLGSYIDRDASRLNPLAGLIITLIIIFAFRRFSPGILGNVIIAASVLMTISIMAANGTPFFVITNAMPVILIGISVADAIHIFSQYFELQSHQPEQDRKILIIETMTEMWRPITLTSLTTSVGFLGLYFASHMPPFKYFGLYTAIGVMIAWAYSMLFLPAAIALIKPSVSRHFIKAQSNAGTDTFANFMQWLGRISLRAPLLTISLFSLIAILGAFSASKLQVDEHRIGTFHSDEPIVAADNAINAYLNGSSTMDIVIETPNTEDLFLPENLRKIEALQAYAQTLPHVTGSTSIVDYLKQMNRSLQGGAEEQYRLPETKELVAQYFLIYAASGNPADFQEEVDYDYRTANIRITLNNGHFNQTRATVETLQHHINTRFNSENIRANLSGRVNLNYHWIKDLGVGHFTGLGLALALVFIVTALLFRSLLAGIYALIPVVSAILFVYAAMVVLNITLGIGTSMFASVAIGLGVDFAIHTIDRLRSLCHFHEGNLDQALAELYPSTGRALLFNFLAIACGFGVLISSKVAPLNNFGTIVALSVTTSFIASMTLLPALIKVFKPTFIVSTGHYKNSSLGWASPLLVTGIALGVATACNLMISSPAYADELVHENLENANWIVDQINQQSDGEQVTQQLTMTTIDRTGKERTRKTQGYRKYFGDEKRTLLIYSSPANVRGTAFLTYDYKNPQQQDDQWLYLPALRKVRRISASDRGDYFLGTDLTYEDIKKERKIEATDYQFTTLQQETQSSSTTYLIEAIPRTSDIADELGYGRYQFWVNSNNWVIYAAEYWDPKGEKLKSLKAEDIRQVNGIWTRHKLTIQNHKTGHQTIFTVEEADYQSPIKDSLFTTSTMSRIL